MQIYLVGGAVRDHLLGRPITERDYVVVEATPEEMLAQGFKPVGKEFPVFLHPKTHEEYALARTERKIAKGYKGFTFYTSPDVTLEEDLKRRDLTINAMAQAANGNIIDPYGGQKDLENKILRHVSIAFAEDPVRILRIARFAARFHDFTIYPDTLKLMKQMVSAGEVNALVPERVWQEFNKALQEEHPERFFEVLQQCNALKILFKPFAENSLGKTISSLKIIAKITKDKTIRFATLFSLISPMATQDLCKMLRAPQEYADLALLISRYYEDYENCLNYDAVTLLNLLESLDAFRRKDRFIKFLEACRAISIHFSELKHERVYQAYLAAITIKVDSLLAIGLKGAGIAKALKEKRTEAIASKII